MSPETINKINNEEYQYQAWVREKKNQIINMTDTSKKQTAWNKLFPPMQISDEWMYSAKVF